MEDMGRPQPEMLCKIQHHHTTRVPHLQENSSSEDPTVSLCLQYYEGPRGMVVSYERGSAVVILLFSTAHETLGTRSVQRS